MSEHSGPLSGVKIIELAGIGPAPFTCMMLADAGAQVLRLERAASGAVERAEQARAAGAGAHWDLLNRSRPSVGIDLKNPDAVDLVLGLVEQADGFVEGFRPGVAERLGFGPDVCLARNPRLVYGRMTGWGQDGPMADMAGHDIDYIAVGGALWPIGREGEAPVPPLNLVGDFGGGGMLLAFGMVAALFEAARSGEGQVIDAAMVDGAASLMTIIHAFRARRHLERAPCAQHPRHRGALLRGLRDGGRTVDGRGGHRAAVLRRAARGVGAGRRRDPPRPAVTRGLARHEGTLRRHLQDQDA